MLSAFARTTDHTKVPFGQKMNHVLGAFTHVGATRFPMVREGSVLPAEMNRPVSWHWHGTVDEGVRLVASRAGYKTEIPLNASSPTVLVNCDDTTLDEILDELTTTSSGLADIEIDVPRHTIRIIWHA